jgi:hypothetical protein
MGALIQLPEQITSEKNFFCKGCDEAAHRDAEKGLPVINREAKRERKKHGRRGYGSKCERGLDRSCHVQFSNRELQATAMGNRNPKY